MNTTIIFGFIVYYYTCDIATLAIRKGGGRGRGSGKILIWVNDGGIVFLAKDKI